MAYAPLFVWIGVIFFLSSSFGSFGETSRFIGPILRFLFPDASPDTLRVYHGIVRKMAHVGVYAVLAILAVRAIRLYGLSRIQVAGISLLIVLITASLDELNQSFLTSRSGSPWDVLLDLSGAVLGVTSGLGIYTRWKDDDPHPPS